MPEILKRIFLRKRINTARRIAGGFALLILAGALLLMLPVSSRTGETTPFLTALFTSTSATCVTGLTLVDTGTYFSVFGQAVLLCLIQIGGLGFMTILCFVYILSKKRIGLRNRMLIAKTMGLDSLEGVVALAKQVLGITLACEAFGAVILSARFAPRFGILKGVWFGIFHSVSAFCNAGFDIIGDGASMLSYRNDPVVLITLALLIVIGGLGFIVWKEIIKKKSWRKLSIYSRVVITATVFLIVFGAAAYFVLEYNNPATIGSDSAAEKILAAFFQSVTTRTAGFDAMRQSNMTEQSKLWSIVLMMIGGASGSTAGGVKVGTVTLVFVSLFAVLRSRKDIVILNRRVGHSVIIHAMALLVLWLALVTAGAAIVSLADGRSVTDSLYEVASAYSTVGLSVGISGGASVLTKLLLIVYMFFGRVGITTISVMFIARSSQKQDIRYPEGDFLVG